MSLTKRYETMKIELSKYDWKDAVDATRWPLMMDVQVIDLFDLSMEMYDGNAIDLVQSIKDRLDTFEKGSYNHQYALDRLNRLFKAYL